MGTPNDEAIVASLGDGGCFFPVLLCLESYEDCFDDSALLASSVNEGSTVITRRRLLGLTNVGVAVAMVWPSFMVMTDTESSFG